MDMELRVLGRVRSELTERDAAPKQGHEGAPRAWIELDPAYSAALLGLEQGQEVEVFTWLHLADRACLQVHPRGDARNPLQGVFNTRSPDRPNPIGVHRVRIAERKGHHALAVEPLEAVDGTPVVDIKPVPGARTWRAPDWEGVPDHAVDALRTACGRAWQRGLMAGFNGNMSLRLGPAVVITRKGSSKGDLTPDDLVALELATGRRLSEGRASSETPMHLALYDAQPEAKAIAHTHPPHLLALSLRVPPETLLDLPLFEADLMAAELALAADHPPGTPALAEAVAEAVRGGRRAVFMVRHGLVCWGETLRQAVALSEELESLARIRLLALGAGTEPTPGADSAE